MSYDCCWLLSVVVIRCFSSAGIQLSLPLEQHGERGGCCSLLLWRMQVHTGETFDKADQNGQLLSCPAQYTERAFVKSRM